MSELNNKNRNQKAKRPNGTGSYYVSSQKPSVIQANIQDIKGKRHTKSFRFSPGNKASFARAETEAQKWLAEQRSAREIGQVTFNAHPKMKVSEFLQRWLESRRPPIVDDSTYRNYEGAIRNWIIPHIGEIKVAEVSLNTIEDLERTLVDLTHKKGTLDLVYRILSKAFKDAVRKKQLVINPMVGVERIKLVSQPTSHIPSQDFKKILKASRKSTWMHARVLVGGVLGLRPGEIYGLKWTDIDHETKTLLIARQVQAVKGKGLVYKEVKQKGERRVSLPPSIYEALQLHRLQQEIEKRQDWNSEDLIFPNTVGKKLDARRDSRWWKQLLREAGVGEYTLYQMRKTAFTNLLTSGVDIKTLMEISGHKQAKTLLDSYTFGTTESLQAAVRVMDGYALLCDTA